jgi:hypothetical protein
MQMRVVLGLIIIIWQLAAEPFEVIKNVGTSAVRRTEAIGRVDVTSLRNRSSLLLGNKEVRVGTLTIYRSMTDLYRAKAQEGTDCNYEGWLNRLEVRGLKNTTRLCPIVGHAIKIGTAIAIRINDEHCEVTLVQEGQDPTHIVLNGVTVEISDVTISQVDSKADQSDITFYVRTDAILTKELGGTVLSYLRRVTQQPRLSVVLRNDNWFITECGFPVLSSFIGKRDSIPDKRTFLEAKQVYCGSQPPWPVRCY